MLAEISQRWGRILEYLKISKQLCLPYPSCKDKARYAGPKGHPIPYTQSHSSIATIIENDDFRVKSSHHVLAERQGTLN